MKTTLLISNLDSQDFDFARHLAENAEGNLNGEQAQFAETIHSSSNDLLSTNHEIAMPDSAPKLSGLRALEVDDQADERELLAAVLSMKEAEVRTAGGMAGEDDHYRLAP